MQIEDWFAVRLSLLVASTAVAASTPLAICIAWLLARFSFRGKLLLEVLLHLPLVLPPVVTGYLLLLLFGRYGWIGSWLDTIAGIHLIFDWKGATLASAVVSFPLLVRPIRLAFEQQDSQLTAAARSLGASPWDAFYSISLPLARPAIVAGMVLAFARSLGEFGATIMIAGNIPGVSQTLSLRIYQLLESPQGTTAAWRLILVSIALAIAALVISERATRAHLPPPSRS